MIPPISKIRKTLKNEVDKTRILKYSCFRVKNKPSNKITHRLNQGNTKQPFGWLAKESPPFQEKK